MCMKYSIYTTKKDTDLKCDRLWYEQWKFKRLRVLKWIDILCFDDKEQSTEFTINFEFQGSLDIKWSS